MQVKVEVVLVKVEFVCVQLQFDYVIVIVLIVGCVWCVFVIEGVFVGQDQVMLFMIVEQFDLIYVNFLQLVVDVDVLCCVVKSGCVMGIVQYDIVVMLLCVDGIVYLLKGKLLFSDFVVDLMMDIVVMCVLFLNLECELLLGVYVWIVFDMVVDWWVIFVLCDVLLCMVDCMLVWVVGVNGKVKDVEVMVDQMSGYDWCIMCGFVGGECVNVDDVVQFVFDMVVKFVEKVLLLKVVLFVVVLQVVVC